MRWLRGPLADYRCRRSGTAPVGLLVAAGLVAGSGLANLAVVPDHWAEYRLFGGFVLLVGVAQLVAAGAAAMWPNPRGLVGVARRRC